MPSGRPSWYPTFGPDVSFNITNAFRVAFDALYTQRDSLGPLALQGRGNASQEISDVAIAVSGCTVTVPRGGQWLVTGNFTIEVIGDSGQLFSGSVAKRGVTQQVQTKAQLNPTGDSIITISQQWVMPAAQGEVFGLTIVKDGGGGTSVIDGLNTTITAAWAGE